MYQVLLFKFRRPFMQRVNGKGACKSMKSYMYFATCIFQALLLDSLKMSFSPGDLIWAKVRGYPHWPARVSSIYFEIKADES